MSVSARLAPLLSLVLLGVAACSADPATLTAEPDPRPASAPTTTETVRVADPEHAVDPPGRLKGRLHGADLLVSARDTLPGRTLERIRRLDGVEHTESLSIAQVGIENRVITVGAVDPATYRAFTPQPSAELQEAWERVAGGELAIDLRLGKQLQDTEGYLRLGNDKDAPTVHIGAFAPQIPRVDAVVNGTWAEDLGMPEGNALIVSTGLTAPQRVRSELRRLLGRDAVVEVLGPDLDVGARQRAILTGGSVAEAVGSFTYTVLGGGRIAPDPAWVRENIRTEQVPILGSVTCHKVVLPQLRAALTEIQRQGLAGEIDPDEYAGCYYPRFIAGSQQLSLHSFGIALDLNVPGNQRGTVGEIDRRVVAIFKQWGFAWGGDWSYTDPMHFEMDAIATPR